MQQSPTDNREFEAIPDDELFHRSLAHISAVWQETFRIACRQRDLIITEREQSAGEIAALKKRVEEKDSDLETIRKSLMDSQMQLTESRRSESSLRLEVKQYKEQLAIYAVDAKRIEEANIQLRAARDEISALRTQIEVMNTTAAKIERDHKSELEKQALKYEQEKVQLYENIQVAEDRAQSAEETVERFQSAVSLAENDKNSVIADFTRERRNLKQQIEKLRSDLAQREGAASELERRITDIQRDYERKMALARSQAEQAHQTQVETLKNEIEERTREVNRLRYQIEQEKEYHRREMETLKLDMAKQIDLRADEIRRQLILQNSGITDSKHQ